MSFNITVRANTKAELQTAVNEKAELQKAHLPKVVKEALDNFIGLLPKIPDGYLQLTAYGHIPTASGPGSIVINLSSHADG